jgi:TorA maturation chaperone TorD
MTRSEDGSNKPLPPVHLPNLEPQIAKSEAITPAFRARALVSPNWQSVISKASESAIDAANSRSFIYRFLAKAFSLPQSSAWEWLCNPAIQAAFCGAVRRLTTEQQTVLRECATSLMAQFHPGQFDLFQNDYLSAFGNTVSYASTRTIGNLRPTAGTTRKTDWESFFRALGLELAPGGSQQDQLAIALEFVSLLAAKETVALERQPQGDPSDRYHLAQQKFLSGYLADYVGNLCQTLNVGSETGLFPNLFRFTHAFVQFECLERRQSFP